MSQFTLKNTLLSVSECHTHTIFLDFLLKKVYNIQIMTVTYLNHKFSSYLDLFYYMVNLQGENAPYPRFIPEEKYLFIYFLLRDKFPEREWSIPIVKQFLAEELALHHITLYDKGCKNASSC